MAVERRHDLVGVVELFDDEGNEVLAVSPSTTASKTVSVSSNATAIFVSIIFTN
jgi:hypothetical protein